MAGDETDEGNPARGDRATADRGKFAARDVVPYCLGRVACPVDTCAGQQAPVRPVDDTRPPAMLKAGEF